MKALLALLLVTGPAFAVENGSEYMHQAPASTPELTPFLSSKAEVLKGRNGGKVEVGGVATGVLFEYGLNEMFSAGARLGFEAYSAKLTPASGTVLDDTRTKAGMQDLGLFFHGRSGRDLSLRYGLDLGVALGKEKFKDNGDVNSYSGGIAAAPFLGLEWVRGRNTFGFNALYMHWIADRKGEQEGSSTSNGYSYTYKGGGVFKPSVFYEADVSIVTIGAALSIAYSNDQEVRQDGKDPDRSAGTTTWNLKVYVPVHVTPTITILPELSYGEVSALNNAVYESDRTSTFQVAGRFAF